MLVTLFMAIGFMASAQVVVVRPSAPVVIKTRPIAPSPRHIWIDGEWAWRGGRYVWVDGYWVVPRANMIWVAGNWRHRRGGWVWVPGHWRRTVM